MISWFRTGAPSQIFCHGRGGIVTLTVLLLSGAHPMAAQSGTASEGSFWAGYMSSWWFGPSRAIWFDTHYNVDSFFMLRGGLTHALDVGATVTAGYAFVLLNPDLSRHEHRPWAQAFAPFRLSDAWSVSGRLRLDFRFRQNLDDGLVTSGYDFTLRTRLQATVTRRFKPTRYGEPLIQLADELLLNAFADPADGTVDQNRLSLLAGLEMERLTIRIGYMNRYLPNSLAGAGLVEHNLIVWFTHTVNIGRWTRRQQPDYDDYPERGVP